MSELRIESWTMPAADLGPENPLPPLRPVREAHDLEVTPGIPKEMARNVAYGHIPNPLPYTLQNRYNRKRAPRDFRVAVLENERLRATFMLERDGRLWSLVDKAHDRELLYVNPVFQPANLAIRNAWFSGGVEWNIGTIGHSVFTCSPLHAARVQADDGTPILRLYEWERIRGVPFQIDAYLPDGSPVLFVRVRIVNPHDRTVPMYWWSNMAVPETPGTRVLAPADSAYTFSYRRGLLEEVPIPTIDKTDVTYTTRSDRAADYFFRIRDGQRRWITALDETGRGLVQTSTDRLRGRKLFLWGQGPGGARWQAFLSRPGQAYLEIQAGLARTQAEHLPMPAHATWSWLEAYGPMHADPDLVHGKDWAAATGAVAGQLETLIPREELDAEFERGKAWVDRAPEEIVQRGSGWGALEQRRRAAMGEPPFPAAGLVFDAAGLGETQAPWLALLADGALPKADPTAEPQGFMVQPAWRELLEDAVAAGRGEHWASWWHLGLMRYQAGETDAAKAAWQKSLETAETPWAHRNLAVLAGDAGRWEEAAEHYLAACALRPDLTPLAVECGQALIEAGREAEWLSQVAKLPEAVRQAGRVRLLAGQAALAVDDFQRVKALFADPPVVTDLREGEVSLSALWFAYHERRLSQRQGIPVDAALRAQVRRDYPVPEALDFRMGGES